MALNFAKAFGIPVVILPKKDNREEWEAESRKIYENLSFFYDSLLKIDFDERGRYEDEAVDIIGTLKAGKLPDGAWLEFAKYRLTPTESTLELPVYRELIGKRNVMIVPQKLISDGECGVTAAQQSLNQSVFYFLKDDVYRKMFNFVLGQHFDKVKDLAIVEALAKEFNMYVPGMTEHKEVFGIRGVQHKLYYNLYKQLRACIGIAGTHTWVLLTMFPEIPQIILYNKNGVENWGAIAQAFQKQGRKIYALGFDEKTNMTEFSKQIEKLSVVILS